MADVASDIKDWSTTASSNSPTDATTIGAGLADNLQQIQATVVTAFRHKGADIASASTTDLGGTVGLYHDITGTTTITSFGSTAATGTWKLLQFDGALSITYNATSMIIPGNASITTAAGDMAMVIHEGSGNWRMLWYTKDAAGATPPFRTSNGGVPILADVSDPTKLVDLDLSGLTTATTRTLTVQDEDGTIALTSEFVYSNLAGSNGRMLMPTGYIQGLVMSNGTDSTNDIDISAGICADATGAHNMILSSSLTKQIDAAWAVGSGQGGMDTGTVADSTWYYVWLIKRSDTGVVDALYSLSSTSPTMPTNYDYKRLIGAVYRNSSASIKQFYAFELSGGGIEVNWTTPTADISGSNIVTTTAAQFTVSTPTAFSTRVKMRFGMTDANGQQYVLARSPTETDSAPSPTAAPGVSYRALSFASGTGWEQYVRTDSSGQIELISNLSVDSFFGTTVSWEWARR